MTAVFLDTNIVLTDPTLGGAHISKLLIGCKRCGIPIFIPEIVRDEIEGHRQQRVAQYLGKIDGDVKALARLGLTYVQPKIDLDREQSDYRARVNAILAKFDVRRLDYPKVSPKELIQASYANRKPFKATGEGCKDYLVFKTLLALLSDESEVHFLTNNRKDFCADDGTLHPDLRIAIPEEAIVTVYESAQNFYNEVLASRLENLGPLDAPEAIVEAIKQGTFPGFDLEDKLEAQLVDQLVEGQPDLDELSIPLDDVSVTQVMGFTVDEVHVSALDENLLTVDIKGQVEMEVFGFMEKWAYFGSEGDLDVHLDNGDWNDHVVSAHATTDARFQMSVIFDQEQHEVRSVDVEIASLR